MLLLFAKVSAFSLCRAS